METDPLSTLPSCNIIIHEDISDSDNITETICPLCRCYLKLYQIHYDEKFLMCGNINCPYPFGVTDYHIYKIECNEEFVRNECGSSVMSVTTGSSISNSDWLELDRMLQNDSSYNQVGSPTPSLVEKPQEIEKLKKLKKTVESEEIIKKNVKRIKELNKQLFRHDDFDCISNDRWIKHIAQMQERSGVQVLKDHELKRVKKVPTIGAGELKINIESKGNSISLKIGVPDEDKAK